MTAPVPSTDAEVRRAAAALDVFGCPRPDKHHYATEAHAHDGLRRALAAHREPDAGRTVYRCPCGGWVWGRSDP